MEVEVEEEKRVQAPELITAVKCSYFKCVSGNIRQAQYAQTLLVIMLCHLGGEERELLDTIYFKMFYLTPVQQMPLYQPGMDAKHAFILLPIKLGGKDTVLDITVINPLQTPHIDQSAAVLGRAL